MSIYGCGDTHMPMDIHKLNAKNFPEQKTMTKQDYVIVMGDFGLYWEDVMDKSEIYWMKWLNDRNFTTLFLDGNHENHKKLMSGYLAQDLLNTNYAFIDPSVRENYGIVYKPEFGGYVGKLSDSIYHLRRGEIYTIQGKKFFVMGGAESIDKHERIEGKSWWPEELPNRREFYYGLDNLDKHGKSVDYILGHTCPNKIVQKYLLKYDCGKSDPVTKYFDRVVEIAQFKAFYFGHWHFDGVFENKYYALYNNIVRIV